MPPTARILLLLFVCGVGANETFLNAKLRGSSSIKCIFPAHDKANQLRETSIRQMIIDNHVENAIQSSQLRKLGSSGRRSLVVRGGASFMPGKEVLTFSQNLSGSAFSLLSVIYGIACGLAAGRTSHFLYGYDESDKANSPDVGHFLMRLMGTIACSIGLTAVFAIAAELKVLGRVPTSENFAHAIGIGLIPRMLLIVPTLFTGMPSALRINRTDAVVAFIHNVAFGMSMLIGKVIPPDSVMWLEVAFHLLLGPLIFFRPALLFQPSSPPSRHEKFMTRLVASYSVVGAILLMGLQHPDINALPAIGMAAIAYVASLIHLIFIRKDIKHCESSVTAHIVMMTIGAAVATGGLRHFLVI
mmetsp:Transcript_55530/g.166476  ORF Transcript_55530/g.166476 Transcript_55530/m.166476 type:complete len:358 (+) Transcript_55530:113-1186(+)